MFLEISQKMFLEISPQACNFIKKEALAQVVSVNFVKFLRTPQVAASNNNAVVSSTLIAINLSSFQFMFQLFIYLFYSYIT